ncbi:MAG: hypothetical protein ACFFD4_18965 [Candidatus Odinarchaeota archaeon]
MKVLMPSRVYREFLRFTLEHARPDRRQTWKEVIGLLFGKFGDDGVIITDVFLPPSQKYATFVKVGDYSFISDLMVKKLEKGEYIIGWIHSHPGFGLFLSNTDVETQRLYETMDERAIAIVVDQTLILRGGGQDGSGMGAFQLDPVKNYRNIPLGIQDITDFQDEYRTLASEVVKQYLVEVPGIYAVDTSPRPVADTGSISFTLLAPEAVAGEKHFRVKLKCEVFEPSYGKVTLDFTLELRNAALVTRHWKKFRVSFIPRRSGTVAIFTLIAKAEPGENAVVSFSGLRAASGGQKRLIGDLSRLVKVH